MNKEDMIIARLDRMEHKLDTAVESIAGLKVKAGVWGLLAGLIPVIVGMAMMYMAVPK